MFVLEKANTVEPPMEKLTCWMIIECRTTLLLDVSNMYWQTVYVSVGFANCIVLSCKINFLPMKTIDFLSNNNKMIMMTDDAIMIMIIIIVNHNNSLINDYDNNDDDVDNVDNNNRCYCYYYCCLLLLSGYIPVKTIDFLSNDNEMMMQWW